MKNFLLSALCVSFFSLQAQNKRLALQIKTDDKPTMHGFSYWQQVKIASKDTSFVAPLHRSNPDIFKNLKPASYSATFISVFNHRFTKKIELNKKTPLIKIAGLNAYYKHSNTPALLSEKMKTGDTLFILYSTVQSENTREKLAVIKMTGGYNVVQFHGITNEILQQMQVSGEKFKVVIKFESDGKKANSPKAETAPVAEIYTVELNKEISSFIVPGEWNGFNTLKASLLAIEQK